MYSNRKFPHSASNAQICDNTQFLIIHNSNMKRVFPKIDIQHSLILYVGFQINEDINYSHNRLLK